MLLPVKPNSRSRHLAALLPHLFLTGEQLDSPHGPPWPSGTPKSRAVRYQCLFVVALGVVLIKAPGHTPGSQLVYVCRADGRKYLFMGDTVSMADNIRLRSQRLRFVTSVRGNSNRQQVADE